MAGNVQVGRVLLSSNPPVRLRYPAFMPRYSYATVALLGLLLIPPAPAQARGKARTKARVLKPGKALKVTWKLSPYSCHLMELTARRPVEPIAPKKNKPGGRPPAKVMSISVLGDQHLRAPLSVLMVDGKVRRSLSSERGELARRLCSGSNSLKIQLSLTSTARARLTARLTPAELSIPSRQQDPGRAAWLVTSGLYQAPFPGGNTRTLMQAAGRVLGAKLPPLTARLNLAKGHCSQLQVRAAASGDLKLKVLDADGKPLFKQVLKAEEDQLLVSKKVCPARTESHRLVLSAEGNPRAVAWRLVAHPLTR
jgi:hypothetical protein